jgi:hypothetical protein
VDGNEEGISTSRLDSVQLGLAQKIFLVNKPETVLSACNERYLIYINMPLAAAVPLVWTVDVSEKVFIQI